MWWFASHWLPTGEKCLLEQDPPNQNHHQKTNQAVMQTVSDL